MALLSPAQLVRRQAQHPDMKPPRCNGWYHPVDQVILHSGAFCPVHDADDTVKGS